MKRVQLTWLAGVVLLLLFSLTSCNNNSEPEPYQSLRLATFMEDASVGTTGSIAIWGSGHYTVSVDKPEIAKVWIAEERLHYEALQNGTCVATVTDTRSKETATFKIIVKPFVYPYSSGEGN